MKFLRCMEDVATGSVAVFIILKMLQNIYYLISILIIIAYRVRLRVYSL